MGCRSEETAGNVKKITWLTKLVDLSEIKETILGEKIQLVWDLIVSYLCAIDEVRALMAKSQHQRLQFLQPLPSRSDGWLNFNDAHSGCNEGVTLTLRQSASQTSLESVITLLCSCLTLQHWLLSDSSPTSAHKYFRSVQPSICMYGSHCILGFTSDTLLFYRCSRIIRKS